MDDILFNEIKEAFARKFKNFELTKKPLYLEVRFQSVTEGDWFYNNICYPKDLKREDYPIECILSMTPLDGKGVILDAKYFIAFKVNNKNKLIQMIS